MPAIALTNSIEKILLLLVLLLLLVPLLPTAGPGNGAGARVLFTEPVAIVIGSAISSSAGCSVHWS